MTRYLLALLAALGLTFAIAAPAQADPGGTLTLAGADCSLVMNASHSGNISTFSSSDQGSQCSIYKIRQVTIVTNLPAGQHSLKDLDGRANYERMTTSQYGGFSYGVVTLEYPGGECFNFVLAQRISEANEGCP